MNAVFAERYSHTGGPSVAPEKLLRALLLQVLYTIRSERQLMSNGLENFPKISGKDRRKVSS